MGDIFVPLGEALCFQAAAAGITATRHHRAPPIYESVKTEAATVAKSACGCAERPYAPLHLAGPRDGSANNLALAWVRRTRLGGALLDGTGAVPLAEAAEAYEVDIRNAADTATLRTITATTPSASYTAAQQVADGLTPGAPVRIRIFQISATVGRGIPGSALL